jgi:hypothetical protein
MKVRLAKKILFGSNEGYWLERIIRAAIDEKEDDHRVVKAFQIYHRKRRRKEVKL